MTAEQTTIYLDNNATTAIDPRVLDAMLPYLKGAFGNAASRTHAFGWEGEEAVNKGRKQVAQLIVETGVDFLERGFPVGFRHREESIKPGVELLKARRVHGSSVRVDSKMGRSFTALRRSRCRMIWN